MAQDSPSRHSDQYPIRLPDGMRDEIKATAKTNQRSMNAEIVARLSESFGTSETLRDRFAMAALIGQMSNPDITSLVLVAAKEVEIGITDAYTTWAYELADAMLRARQPTPPTSPDKES